jgi:serine O-acetyltransferase
MNTDTHPKIGALLDADWARLSSQSGLVGAKRGFLAALSPRFAPVVLIRVSRLLHVRNFSRAAKLVSLINFVVFGIEVSPRIPIGPGLIIPHTHGSVIGAASIGANVTIFQQVTLGAKYGDYVFQPSTRPVIHDDVVLSAGAKVIGAVVVGSGSVVGANAVVLDDVPQNHIAVGVPAIAIARKP